MTIEEFEAKANKFVEKRNSSTMSNKATAVKSKADELKEFEAKANKFIEKRNTIVAQSNIPATAETTPVQPKKETIADKMNQLWVEDTPQNNNNTSYKATSVKDFVNSVKNEVPQPAPKTPALPNNNTYKPVNVKDFVDSINNKAVVEAGYDPNNFSLKEKALLNSGNYSVNPNYDPKNKYSKKVIYTGNVLTNKDVDPTLGQKLGNTVERTGRTAMDFVGNVATGVTQAGEGLVDAGVANTGNFLSNLTSVGGLLPNKVSEGIRQGSENFVKYGLASDMKKMIDEDSQKGSGIYNPKILGLPVRNAVQEIARMYTTSLAGGLPTMMLSAAGNSTEQALNEGQQLNNAVTYGNVAGAIEGATEKMFDAPKLFGGGLFSKLSGKMSNTFASKILEATVGEGIEEVVSEAINPFVKILTYEGKVENPFGSKENFWGYLHDIGVAGYQGALIGALTLGTSAPNNIELQKAFSNDVYKALDKVQGVDQVRKNEIANKIIEGAKTVTGEDVKNIRSFVENYKKNAGVSEYLSNDFKNNINSTIQNQNVQGLPKNSLRERLQSVQNNTGNEITPGKIQAPQNANMNVETQNTVKQRIINTINNNSQLTAEEKQSLLQILEENSNNLTPDAVNFFNDTINNLQNNRLEQVTNTEDKKATYKKYLNDKTELDKTALDTAKNSVPANKSGRRTKEQWLKVANTIGQQIYDLSDSEIERYAYKSWQETHPNQSGNLNRQGKGFVKFTSDEWIDAITKSAQQAKSQTQANNKLPTKSEQISKLSNKIKNDTSVETNDLKQKQLNIIQKSNPMRDDYHTGIRTIDDIKTFQDTIDDKESFVYGDFSREDAIKALEKGEVKVYSSKPIENGNFVSTSYNQAKDYAGTGKIYSKTVPLTDVAWISGDEGQYARANKNVENVQQMKYNEKRGDGDGKLQSRGILGGNNQQSRIYEKNKSEQAQRYTKEGYEQFERKITPISEERLTESERKLINQYKTKHNKNIVLFDGKENEGFGGGASLTDKNKIYVDINAAKEFGYNMIASHEVMESDILHNKEQKADIIEGIIEAIINDNNFEQQKSEFWVGQEGDMPSDYLIAKDLICDRFAELDNGETLSYKNVLSPETNLTIDYGISNFRNEIKNNKAGKQSASFLPSTDNQGRTLSKQQQEYFKDSKVRDEEGNLTPNEDIRKFKSSESPRPYMNLNEKISMNNNSKHNKTGLAQIEETINEIVPVRHGKFRQKAYGIYKGRGEIIRIKQKNDIPTALHELTHHLDKQLALSKTGNFDSELIPIAVVEDSASLDTKRAEGVAEFGRYYMTDPEFAQEIAPKYFEAFEEKLNQNPEMKAKVQQLQNMVSDYLRQSPLNRVLSHIDYGDDTANIFTRAKDRALEFKKSFRKNFIDDLDPLKKVINEITNGKKLPVDENAYARLRLHRGVTGKVQVALEHGIVDTQGNKIGKSLKEIVAPVSDNIDEFVAYISALRAKDLETRNIDSGFNKKDVDEILSLYGDNEKFNKAAEELYSFENAILQKTLVASGIITPEQLKAYNKANPHYVPFYRVMDENFKQSKDGLSKVPKRIKGSTRDIINPLESIIKNTYSYYTIAEKNNAYKSLFNLANQYDGTGKWFDKVPTDMTGTKISANDIKSLLDKLDLDKTDIDYNELFTTIFKPANYQKGNIITVMENGKPVHYEIMDEDLYRILAPSNSKVDNFFLTALNKGATALRTGATHSLEFVFRNPIRDTFDAGTYSKNNFIPFIDTIRGIFDVFGKTDLYYKWLESGGSGSSYTNAQRTTLRNTLKGIIPEVNKQSKLDTVANVIKHPLRTYLDIVGGISNIMEEGTRVGEFRKALKNTGNLKQSALESRDITVDFSRGGEQAKQLNRYIAFLNANIQGLDKMFTSFKERPVATTLKGLAYLTLPSILIRALQDDDDLDKVPQWEKDAFWVFFIGNTPIKIPKPQGLGQLFATVPERVVDFIKTQDPSALDDIVWHILGSYSPIDSSTSLIPTGAQPIIENTVNYSFFKNQPIVKQSLQNRSPKYQYDENTSTLAKKIGGAFNVSPKQIDNLISGYFGNLGKDVANVLGVPFDIAEGKEKSYESTNTKLKKIPLVKGFIASDYSSKKLNKFYDEKSEALSQYNDIKFKYSDKKELTNSEQKEVDLAKQINSLYNSAYNKIKDKNDEKDKIENGDYTDSYKEGRLKLIDKEIDDIASKTSEDAEILRKRNTLPTAK